MGGSWNKIANRKTGRQPETQAEKRTDKNEIIGLPAETGQKVQKLYAGYYLYLTFS